MDAELGIPRELRPGQVVAAARVQRGLALPASVDDGATYVPPCEAAAVLVNDVDHDMPATRTQRQLGGAQVDLNLAGRSRDLDDSLVARISEQLMCLHQQACARRQRPVGVDIDVDAQRRPAGRQRGHKLGALTYDPCPY